PKEAPRSLLYVLLELPQDRVAAGDRIVERGPGLALAGEHAFEILGDDVADLHQIAEPQSARILGRRFAGQLQDRDLAARVLVVEPRGLGRLISGLGDRQIAGHLMHLALYLGARQKREKFGNALV